MGMGATGSIRELHTTSVDDVPAFFVNTGQTPTATLSFRAGLADETLPTHGWLHLLEHMAMHGRDNPRIQTNASVGLWMTEFTVSGEQDDVVAFLNDLSQWLAAPDFGDLEHERRILKAEWAQRPSGDFATHLDYRCGAQGVGLLTYREFGLHTASEDGLAQLARRLFVRGNASLALNCAPPAGLSLSLAEGPRVPIPSAPTLPLASPGHVQGNTPFIGVSGILRNSPVSPIVSELVSRSMTDRLRHELGSSYGTTGTLERMDEDQLLLCLSADVVEDRAKSGVELAHGVLTRLATHGVDQAEFDGVRQRGLRHLRDDPTGAWQAFNSAAAELRGAGPFTVDVVQEHLETLVPELVNSEIRAFVDSVLYSSPTGKESITFVPFQTGVTEAAMQGEPVLFRTWKATDLSQLAISPQTVEITGQNVRHGRAVDSLVGLLKHPDGARTIIANDGGSLHVETNLWRDGEQAVALLDDLVDPSGHIPTDPRDADQIAALPTRRARLMRPVTAMFHNPWLGFLFLGVMFLPFVVILLAAGHVLPVVALLTFMGAAVAGWRKEQ